jgi:purine-binding chemotaxis protein CheW
MKDAGNTAADDIRQILRKRAQALAQPPQRAPDGDLSFLELLEFRLARESYAIETRYAHEVVPLKNLTPLPCTPSFVAGIVNVRGRIVAVLDLRKFFDLPLPGLTDQHRIILVRGNDAELGLLADAVVGLRTVPAESLQPSLPTLTGIRADYLRGVMAAGLVVLDVGRILADPRILVNEEVSD